MAEITVGGVDLPSPTGIRSADEVIWSEDAGRSASGKMLGDVVAEKKTLDITWEMLTETQAALIKNKLASGFFSITFRDYGSSITITSYRSTIQKEHLGYVGNVYYYRSITVSIIQQ